MEKNILLAKLYEITQKEAEENNAKRFSLFPIVDEKSYEFYKKHEASIWSANEMDFIRDKKDYENLSPEKKHLINLILGFFAPGDGLISQNLALRFLLECKNYEEQSFFITQMFMELVHAETYGMTIISLIPNENEQQKIFNLCENSNVVKQKVDWMTKYLYSNEPRVVRLAAFAVAEGVFFSVLFAIIFWFRSQGVLQNFIFSNEQISKDESLHRDYAVHLFKREFSQLSPSDQLVIKDRVLNLITEGYQIESSFIKELIPQPINDLNFSDLDNYAKSVVDNLVISLGFSPFFNSKNPLPWMHDISLQQKGNFYDVRIGSYKNFSVTDALNWRKRVGITSNTVSPYSNFESVNF